MERDQVLTIVQDTANEFAKSNGHDVSEEGVSDDLLTSYGFTSLDALEFLLVIEEKFDITLEDEELTEAVLSSISQLVDSIHARVEDRSGNLA